MSAAAGASAAAAAAARRMRQEEEELTSYGPQDLSEGWEFKILRSSTSAFKNPERLKSVLAEEAAAGWTLVEKFDNGRIRLKRPLSARAGDHALGFDRTWIGMTDGKLGLMIAGIIVVAMLLVILIVGLASRR